jgi:RHS repeat-associated protein
MLTTTRTHTDLLVCDRANSVLQRLGAAAPRAFAHSPYGLRTPTADAEPGMGFNGQYLERYGGYLLGNGYRTYVTQLRRFASPDTLSPFGTGGLNAYMYCGGEPINQRDPSGHATEDIFPGAVTGVGVLLAFLGFRSAIRNRALSSRALAKIIGGAAAAGLGVLALTSPEQGMKTGLAVGGVAFAGIGAISGLYRKGDPMMSKKVKAKSPTQEGSTTSVSTNTTRPSVAHSDMSSFEIDTKVAEIESVHLAQAKSPANNDRIAADLRMKKINSTHNRDLQDAFLAIESGRPVPGPSRHLKEYNRLMRKD